MLQRRAAIGLALLALLAGIALVGCGQAAAAPKHPKTTPHPTPSPSTAPTAVTVLAPDGVNFRSGPSSTASVTGIVAQGVTLPIVSHSSADGGWWEVKGSSADGWITANSQDTSTASFQTYQGGASTAPWSVLYQSGWDFAQANTGVIVFSGPSAETITVTQAATTQLLPAAAPSGTTQRDVTSVEVYGVTTAQVTYAGSGYLSAVAFQADPGLAFLIVAKAPRASAAATFSLFLKTFKFPLPSS
jgi:uncharacterized protein YgiM (DUF1202 family)